MIFVDFTDKYIALIFYLCPNTIPAKDIGLIYDHLFSNRYNQGKFSGTINEAIYYPLSNRKVPRYFE